MVPRNSLEIGRRTHARQLLTRGLYALGNVEHLWTGAIAIRRKLLQRCKMPLPKRYVALLLDAQALLVPVARQHRFAVEKPAEARIVQSSCLRIRRAP